MQDMFQGAEAFNQAINNWDVTGVGSMISMFNNAKLFNQNIGAWGSGGNLFHPQLDFGRMFRGALAFNNGGSSDINNWNVSMITDMYQMFSGHDGQPAQFTSFNQPLGNWDVGQVTDMGYMFRNASAFNQDLSSWDVGQVTDMRYMFRNASAFNQDLSSWFPLNSSLVLNMLHIFNGSGVGPQDWSGNINWSNAADLIQPITGFYENGDDYTTGSTHAGPKN